MSAQPEEFEQLRKLLAWKRHEQPPPRYFSELADHVTGRLHAPEFAAPLTWWQRLGLDFDLKPALVCALGVVVSGLLLAGIIVSLQLEGTSVAEVRPTAEVALAPPGAPVALAGLNLHPIVRPEEIPASTAPVMSAASASSPFSQLTLHAQKAGFTFNLGN